MFDEYCARLSSNSSRVQDPSKPQNAFQGQTKASAFRFFVGQKRKSSHRLLLSACLCVIVLLFLAAPALSADVNLGWDPNGEANLEGYGVYYKQGASGPPYNLFGYVSLQELNDPDNPAFTLTGLQKGSRYYFAVTAYSTAGNESGYSTPVCAQIGDQILPCTSSSGSGGSSGGSGGSSGGSGGSSGGSGGSSGGSGGSSGGSGGSSADSGGASADSGGASADSGGASADSGGASADSGGASADSGGHGRRNGCFIETSSDHQNNPRILMVTLSFLGAIYFMRFRRLRDLFTNGR